MKDAQRYERLAKAAREGGWSKVTASAVHSWVKRGILAGSEIEHTDFGIRRIEEPADVLEHLARLCHYRYDLKVRDIALVGLLVWIDGFGVRDSGVREGLQRLARLPTRLLRVLRAPGSSALSNGDRLGQAAVVAVFDQDLGARVGRPDISRALLASGLADFAGLLLDPTGSSVADRDGLNELGKLGGLDRARRYGRKAGQPTWSPLEPADALLGVIPHITEMSLVDRIASASSDELVQARRDGRIIAAALLFVAEHNEIPAYRDSGLGQVAKTTPPHLFGAYAVLAALANPSARDLADALVSMATEIDTAGKMT